MIAGWQDNIDDIDVDMIIKVQFNIIQKLLFLENI